MTGKDMSGCKENDGKEANHGNTNPTKLADVEEVRKPVLFTIRRMKWNRVRIVFCHY